MAHLTKDVDLGRIRVLEIEFTFEQSKQAGGGLFGKIKNLKGADPDMTVIAFKGTMPVDAADPKNRNVILAGAVVHHGDAKRKGTEQVTIDLTRLTREDSDITGFAAVVACKAGFANIVPIARFYDNSTGEREWIDNVRFDITGNHTSALLGVVRKVATGWQYRTTESYGQAGAWQEMASLATVQLR